MLGRGAGTAGREEDAPPERRALLVERHVRVGQALELVQDSRLEQDVIIYNVAIIACGKGGQ